MRTHVLTWLGRPCCVGGGSPSGGCGAVAATADPIGDGEGVSGELSYPASRSNIPAGSARGLWRLPVQQVSGARAKDQVTKVINRVQSDTVVIVSLESA